MSWFLSGLEVDELPAGYAYLNEALDTVIAGPSAAPDNLSPNVLHAAGDGVTPDGPIKCSALVEDLAAIDQQLTAWDPYSSDKLALDVNWH